MAVSFVGAGTLVGGTNPLTAAWPSGHQAGDLALIVYGCDIAAYSPTPPSGWYHAPSSPFTYVYITARTLVVMYKFATSSSESNVTFDVGATPGTAAMSILVFRGVDQSAPFAGARSQMVLNMGWWGYPELYCRGSTDDMLVALGTAVVDSTAGQFSGWSCANGTNVTERLDTGTTTGNGTNLQCCTANPNAEGYTAIDASTYPSGWVLGASYLLSPAPMAAINISEVGYAYGANTSSKDISFIAPAGALVIIDIELIHTTSRTINTPSGCTEVAAQQNCAYNTTTYYNSRKWVSIVATGGTQTVTITTSGSTYIYATAYAFLGLYNASVKDSQSWTLTTSGNLAYDALDAGRLAMRFGAAYNSSANVITGMSVPTNFLKWVCTSTDESNGTVSKGYQKSIWRATTAATASAFSDSVGNESRSMIHAVMVDGDTSQGGGLFWAQDA